MSTKIISILLMVICTNMACATDFITFKQSSTSDVELTGTSDTITYDPLDWKGVRIAVENLRNDFKAVTGSANAPIVVGTIGKSKLTKKYKLQSKELLGKWEQYLIFTDRGKLVILGSDKRGTIYGIYELSRQIGVSPWYWMADAPIRKHEQIFAKSGIYTDGEPKVKYRGIFINDEWPSFGGWCNNKFGGINSKAYARIFELMLRLKANYFWPAMWGTNFNEDDPESPRLADEMGIVMGTSHHEPMMRSHREYLQRKEQIPAEAQDAFYQLVYYPAVASAGVAMMYNAATIGDSITIDHLMAKDARLTEYYNKLMAAGKWDGMMRDNHIGYTMWSIPEKNRHPMTLGYKVANDLSASRITKEYSISACDYTRKDEGWTILPDLGRSKGCMGAKDVMKEWSTDGNGPKLEFEIELEAGVAIGILPTQDVMPARGLRLGVQFDDQPMQIIDARQGLHDEFQEYTPKNLAQSKVLKPLPQHNNLLLSGWKDGRKQLRRDEVFDNMRWLEIPLNVSPGHHALKLIMIDPEVVIDQIVVNPDNQRYSYFGAGYQ